MTFKNLPSRRTLLRLPGALFASPIAAADTVAYTDKRGLTVRIQTPVHRAIAFQLYEFFPALKCWDRIVGVPRYVFDSDLVMAAQPEIVKRIPVVGGSSDINMEALLKVNPEIVLAWIYYPNQLRFMEQNGLKVIGLYLDSVAEVYGVVELMGRLFECEREAQHTIERMEAVFELVGKRASGIPLGSRRKVLFLYSSPNQVGGPADLTGKIITLTGAHNAAASVSQRTPTVSVETILSWNPDVIIVWGSARYTAKDILRNPQYRFVSAVREGHVFKAPRWSTWSPRLALQTLWMATKVYPDLYRDVNLRAITEQFYREVFHIPFTSNNRINDY